MAKLAGIEGIRAAYVAKMEAAGVKTLERLHTKMLAVNAQKRVVGQTPGAAQVQKWVAHVKTPARGDPFSRHKCLGRLRPVPIPSVAG